jgi:hypothetical protein
MGHEIMDWIHLAPGSLHWQSPVSATMNIPVPLKVKEYLDQLMRHAMIMQSSFICCIKSTVLIVEEDGWTSEPVQAWWQREKLLPLLGIELWLSGTLV